MRAKRRSPTGSPSRLAPVAAALPGSLYRRGGIGRNIVPIVPAAVIQTPIFRDGVRGKALFFDETNKGFLGSDVAE